MEIRSIRFLAEAENDQAELRRLIRRAEVVLAVDTATQREHTLFGTPSFVETVRIGHDVALETLRVEIDENAGELDQLSKLVQSVKGGFEV
jgi:hypothetical protein